MTSYLKAKDKKIKPEYTFMNSNDIYDIIKQLKTQDDILLKQKEIEQKITLKDDIFEDMQKDLNQLKLHEKQQRSIVDFIKNHLETLSDKNTQHDKYIIALSKKIEENNEQLQDLTKLIIGNNIHNKFLKSKKDFIIMCIAIGVPFILSVAAFIFSVLK